jgi:serine protease inhibitor
MTPHGNRRSAALMLSLLALAACGSSAAPPPLGPSASQFSAAAARLGEAELAQLQGETPRKTVLISPLSFEAALAMLSQGARGDTAANLRAGLRFEAQSLTLKGAADGFASLRQNLTSSPGVTLNLADGVWVDRRVALKPDFAADQSGPFAAKIVGADFADPATVGQINGFVASATHDKIPTILAQLKPDSRLVLINALYFKGDWATPFELAATADKPFTTADGRVLQAPTMQRAGAFSYFETPAFQSVALPYKDPRFELVLLLMKDPTAAAPEGWTSALAGANYQQRQGLVAFPRLDLTWGGDLIGSLSAVGLATALGSHADYGGIAAEPFSVGQVIHKTRLVVDEKGSEGAAATAVVMETTARAQVVDHFSFIADRPFWLLLRERTTGAPIFVGYVAAPQG